MTAGWRNRYLAPAYALMIAFVVAVLLGRALDNSGTASQQSSPESTARQQPSLESTVKIQFVLEGTKKPAVDLKGQPVKLSFDDSTTNVGVNGELLVSPSASFRVCVLLPYNWSAPDRRPDPDTGYTCWPSVDPKQDILLTVQRR